MTLEIKNVTGMLDRGEAFLRAKCDRICTDGLSIHIKFTSARGRDIVGYYRWKDQRMVLAVKRRLRYPRAAAYGVGTTPRPASSTARAPYRLVWHEETFTSMDHLFVFVAGHEVWHFLCHSGQRKRDHETKANCNGFAWLREFQAWAGPGHAVAEIPAVPPRPDVACAAMTASPRVPEKPAAARASSLETIAVPSVQSPVPSRERIAASSPAAPKRRPSRRIPVQLELFPR